MIAGVSFSQRRKEASLDSFFWSSHNGGRGSLERKEFDHEILLLQGGGALGAYQAGVYEGLVEAGVRLPGSLASRSAPSTHR